MINIFLILIHLYIWNRHKKEKNFLIIESLAFVLFSLMAIIILQIEVSNYNLQGTYGSDETNYYLWMILIKNGYAIPSQFPAPLYNFVGSLILKTSLVESVIPLRLFNVLTFSISLNLLYIILRRRFEGHINNSKFKLLYLIMSLNGIVVWTAIRNLKDILFISLVIIFIYTTEEILSTRKKIIKYFKLIFINLFVFILFQNLRPFGGLVVLLVSFTIYLMKANKHGKKIISIKHLKNKRLFLLLILIMIWIGFKYIDLDMLNAFRELIYTPMGLGGNTIVNTILEFIRFILGPGPIKSIRQIIVGDVFLVSTKLADYLIFMGACQWWLLLGISFIKFLTNPRLMKKSIKMTLDFFAVTIFVIATYTFVYGGTGDTRLRAMMYIASFGFILPFLTCEKSINIVVKWRWKIENIIYYKQSNRI